MNTHIIHVEKIRKEHWDVNLKKNVPAQVIESYTEPFLSIYNAERRVTEILDHNILYPNDLHRMKTTLEVLDA